MTSTARGELPDFPTRDEDGIVLGMRRPDKTELEFVIVAACLLVPAGYWIVRTVFDLLG